MLVEKKKFETLEKARALVEPGAWMFKIDLKSGYHHVPIHKDYWRYPIGGEFETLLPKCWTISPMEWE
jgi:hypothetical protein